MADETDVKNLFFGLALSNLIVSPIVVLFGGCLWLVGFVRSRAVNHRHENRIERTLFLTNPLIEIFSVVITFFSIANFVNNFLPDAPTIDRVLVYAGACFLLFGVIALFEHYFGEYLEWWSDRAAENDAPSSDGFWTYLAVLCSNLSRVETTPEDRRRERSQQRLIPRSYAPPDPPDPQLSWILTVIRWLISPGRLLSFAIGFVVFSSEGFGLSLSVSLAVLILLSAAVLTDQIKYLYFYWPFRDGHLIEGDSNQLRDRLIMTLRGYWVTTSLGVIIVAMVF